MEPRPLRHTIYRRTLPKSMKGCLLCIAYSLVPSLLALFFHTASSKKTTTGRERQGTRLHVYISLVPRLPPRGRKKTPLFVLQVTKAGVKAWERGYVYIAPLLNIPSSLAVPAPHTVVPASRGQGVCFRDDLLHHSVWGGGNS